MFSNKIDLTRNREHIVPPHVKYPPIPAGHIAPGILFATCCNGSENMDEKHEQKTKWIELAIKLALSLAALFPLYAVLYLTYPASIVAIYLISAVLCTIFAPWEELKKKFLS